MRRSRTDSFKTKKKSKLKGLFRVTLVLALIIFILFTYRTVNLVTVLQGRDGYFQNNVEGRENYLIAYEGEELDTTFLISIENDGAVYLIDIPNNTRVDSENQKVPLNDLYASQGIEGLLHSIDYIFDGSLSLNSYLVIKEEGLTDLIDKLRGLDIYFEDHYDFDSTVFFPGNQNLDSERSSQFFTYIDEENRISYMGRQIKILQSAFDQYLKWSRSLTLVSGLSSMDDYFSTSMNLRELALFRNMLDDISPTESYAMIVPGRTEEVLGGEIWVVDNNVTISVVEDMMANRPITVKDNIVIEVLNGNGVVGIAGKYSLVIEGLGYSEDNIIADNADRLDYQVTTITYPSQYSHLAEEIANQLGVSAEFVEKNTDKITVILGADIN